MAQLQGRSLMTGTDNRSAARPRVRLQSIFLFLVLMVGLLPSCQGMPSEPGRPMDDALLLALASHEQFELGEQTARVGGARLAAYAQGLAPRSPNPHRQLQSMYADFASSVGEGGLGYEHFAAKAQEHMLLADALDTSRARRDARRGRGFQRFIRGLAQAPIKVTQGVGQLLKGTLRVTGTVIAIALEQAPQIAREIVHEKLRELRNLLQGKIDLAWDKVAAKLGLPFAVWLRSKIDPAFVRLRDRVVRNLLGEGRKTPSPGVTETVEEQDESTDRPGYGNWEVELMTDEASCYGGFVWINYWTNLPAIERGGDNCQRALDLTHHVDFFFEPGVGIPLSFELDSGNLRGGFDVRSFDNPAPWEQVEGTVSAEIEGGWVRPRADGRGWEFGGEFETTVHGLVGLECWYAPDDPMVAGYFHWIADDKQVVVRTPFRGSTYQYVEGTGEEPGRVTPGGTLQLTVGTPYEGTFPSEPMLEAWCEDQSLPAEFPPPVPPAAE